MKRSVSRGAEGDSTVFDRSAPSSLKNLFEDTEDKTPASEYFSVCQDLRQLLGPLVPALLRDEKGALDLSKISAKDFAEFKKFLQDQVALNDGKSFRDPYRSLLEDGHFLPLLKLLYQETHPQQFVCLPVGEAELLLAEFQARLIEIDADAFVQRNFSSKEGRNRLRHVLGDISLYTRDQRADVTKAIARAGRESDWVLAEAITRRFSPSETLNLGFWNYFNIGVTGQDLEDASPWAEEILQGAEEMDEQADERRTQAGEGSHKLSILPPHLEGYEREIGPEEVQAYAKLQQEKGRQADPVSEVQAHLANLWLLTVNPRNFKVENEQARYEHRAWVLKKLEGFLESSKLIKTEKDFIKFNKELQDFLKGPLYTEGDSAFTWARHKLIGYGLDQVYENVDPRLRGPYDQLVKLSDEWKYAVETGEKVILGTNELKTSDPQLGKAASTLIMGLQKTKRELGYNYKQHKAVSRVASELTWLNNHAYQAARMAGSEYAKDLAVGDFAQIQAANDEIDRTIARLQRADSPEAIQAEIDKIYAGLKEDGVFYNAFQAAEMDGTEQFIGVLQTAAIIMATTYVTRGGNVAVGTGVVAARAALAAGWAERAIEGFLWGAYITTAENIVAVSSGEVRRGPETVDKWFKDAVATGASMALTGVLPESAAAHEALIKNLWARYTVGGIRGARHFLVDAGMETVEEVVDQYTRQVLDGNTDALTWAELQELTALCFAGGFIKVGAVAEAIKGPSVEHEKSNIENVGAGPRPVLSMSKDARVVGEGSHRGLPLQHPLLSPMWLFLGAGGLGGMGGMGGDGSGKGEAVVSIKTVEKISQKGLDPNFNGDMDALIRGIRKSGAHLITQVRAIGMVASHPNFNGDFAALIQEIRESDVDLIFQVGALGRIASNPNFNGDFTAFIQEVRESDVDSIFQVDALERIASNPNFNGDFAAVMQWVRELGGEGDAGGPGHIIKILASIASNPNFNGDFAALMQEVREAHTEPDTIILALARIASNPNFNGDFVSILKDVRSFETLLGNEEPERIIWSLINALKKIESDPNFDEFLPRLEDFRKKYPHEFGFVPRLFAHLASDPRINPVKREALFDAIIGGFCHQDPRVRLAFIRLTPALLVDPNISQAVRDTYFQGSKNNLQDPDAKVRAAAVQALERIQREHPGIANLAT